MFVQLCKRKLQDIYIELDRERYSDIQSFDTKYDSLIFTHETVIVLNQNHETIFCVERLNLSMKIAKPIQEKQSLLYSFLGKYTLKNGLFESSIQASNSCGGHPSNLT